jgi:hypothetical protein
MEIKVLNKEIDFYETWHKCCAIGSFNFLQSVLIKWKTGKL